MTAIAYINHRQLTSRSCWPILSQYPQHRWQEFFKLHKFNEGIDSNYVRLGKNTLPFKNTHSRRAPVYNANFTQTFADVTDARFQQLRTSHWDKPWLVMWSGGVDSTVILTSILKNTTVEDRTNIHVACNRISVYEYPEFYHRHILPNFRIIDSSAISIDSNLLEQYYIIDGEPADQLFVAGTAQNILFSDPDILTNDVRSNPDQLLSILAKIVDQSFAQWFYEIIMENINSTNIPVETYYDFFWWCAFNLIWDSIHLRSLATQTDTSTDSVQLYLNNFKHWYSTDEYQHWSMTNNVYSKCDLSRISGNKQPAKEYIYEYTNDPYYYMFKLKLYSTGHQRNQYIAPWFCLLDDHTRLYLDRDLEQILQLLPSHINE